MKEYLVEIRIKTWMPDLKSGGRVVCYEEVLASDEYYARHIGFEQFETRAKHSPILRRKIESEGLAMSDCCAPDAVVLD